MKKEQKGVQKNSRGGGKAREGTGGSLVNGDLMGSTRRRRIGDRKKDYDANPFTWRIPKGREKLRLL